MAFTVCRGSFDQSASVKTRKVFPPTPLTVMPLTVFRVDTISGGNGFGLRISCPLRPVTATNAKRVRAARFIISTCGHCRGSQNSRFAGLSQFGPQLLASCRSEAIGTNLPVGVRKTPLGLH